MNKIYTMMVFVLKVNIFLFFLYFLMTFFKRKAGRAKLWFARVQLNSL